MQRLGVVALGMFVRRSLLLRQVEIDVDLSFFRLEREIQLSSGRPLSQADMLLGGFFFVHESKSNRGPKEFTESSADYAFEFLHNTFGEFLTADFILRRVVQEARIIYGLRTRQIARRRA